MELQGKKVMIMGLGLNDGGFGAVKYAISEQASEIIITDLRTADILQETIDKINALPPHTIPIQYILGEQDTKNYIDIDILIKNPGIPDNSLYLIAAEEAGVTITTDIELFFTHIQSLQNPPSIIGITGTRGKTSTTALIHHILSDYYGEERVLLGGNIRKSILSIIPHIQKNSYIVLELSSFQLESIPYSPHISVFTSFFPDHLDRYNSLDEYFEAKTHIVTTQKASDFAVFNIDNTRIAELISQITSQVTTYSLHNNQANIYIENDYILYKGETIIHINDIPIRGEHNQYNVMAAIGVANIAKVPKDNIVQAIKSFVGVSGRQQSLGFVHGVEVINDTASTMPGALIVALETFKDKGHIVICGGEDKGLEYGELSQHIYNTLKGIVLLPGSGSKLIQQHMQNIPIYEVNSLEEAVDKALSLTQSGDRIVFSPGATSFGMFRNAYERGDTFVAIIESKRSL
jgi:UDP-N-acetylmuramoylalanine--D-glutamate ligase